MNKELDKLLKRIDTINEEIRKLNDACAEAIAVATKGVDSRILSYAQEEELNSVIDSYTQKIAKLVVELEELEEVRNAFIPSDED